MRHVIIQCSIAQNLKANGINDYYNLIKAKNPLKCTNLN